MQPLINELQELWQPDILAWDFSIGPNDWLFNLQTMVLWTISDFSRYGMFLKCTLQGYKACPLCGLNITSRYSKPLRKCAYCGSRRWLPEDHPYQQAQNKKHFDNNVEHKLQPLMPTTKEILALVVQTTWLEAGHAHGAQGDPLKNHGVKWRLVFYNLTYFGVT